MGERADPEPLDAEQGIEDASTEPNEDELCSNCSRSHLDAWADPEETLLLLDFDDTLFPIKGEFCDEHLDDLTAHCKVVTQFLRTAVSLCHVCIVTMATPEWVEEQIWKLMPEFRDLMTELKIKIAFARRHEYARDAFRDTRSPSQYLKTQVMKKVVQDFYTSSNGNTMQGELRKRRSWKNIMSIGDSEWERLALQDVVFHHNQRDRHGAWKECRCKTLMLTKEPTFQQLTQELHEVTNWLPTLLHHDGDLDLVFDDVEKTITGEGLGL